MLKLYLGKAHVICCIIMGSFVQAQEFSTTVVKEGEDAIIECGLQTKVKDGYLKWEAITNDTTALLALDIRDGLTDCDDRIINCTLYANGSIHLESVSMKDGARYYRCLRGDDQGYDCYSDHRLLVLPKESPSISQSPTSAIAFKASRNGIVHSYGEPVCEDDVDGNLPVVCYPPSGIIVEREYETIQCNCTDSDGLMDSVTFPVARQMSSRPSIETSHRESVSSYHIEKKGVLHGYNAPLCEDDVDGNLPVVCYPPSGVIVDREYETIQCNCTDSDELMDNVTFLVTSMTHVLHPVWRKAFISVLVILITIVLIFICCKLYEHLKKSQSNCGHAALRFFEGKRWVARARTMLESMLMLSRVDGASDREEMTYVGTKDKQISDLEDKIAELKTKLNNSQTELTEREKEVINLKEQLEQKESQETEMKKKLEEQNEKIQQQQDTASKQDGKKYQEDDNNSEFDKNSSPSEKENKEGGSPRKGKKRDPERRLTLRGYPNVPPQETPGKNNQNDQDVETDIDDSYTTEENENLDKHETDFSKSKRCSNASSNASGTKLRAFKDYFIEDVSKCKGFNLGFKCDGTDMRIELRINDDDDGVICHYEFRNGWIIPSFRGKPEKAIGVTNETSYELNLGDDMRALSLCQRKSAQRNKCLHKLEKYDFLQLRLLCIYTSDTSSVSILSHLGLIEL